MRAKSNQFLLLIFLAFGLIFFVKPDQVSAQAINSCIINPEYITNVTGDILSYNIVVSSEEIDPSDFDHIDNEVEKALAMAAAARASRDSKFPLTVTVISPQGKILATKVHSSSECVAPNDNTCIVTYSTSASNADIVRVADARQYSVKAEKSGVDSCQSSFGVPAKSDTDDDIVQSCDQILSGNYTCVPENRGPIQGAVLCKKSTDRLLCCRGGTADEATGKCSSSNPNDTSGESVFTSDLFDKLNPLNQGDQAGKLDTPGAIITRALEFIFPLAGLFLFIILVWGGFEIVQGATNKKMLDSGKTRIRAGLIGFFLLFISFWLAQAISFIFGVRILGL
jgi:hypothetical protein